MNNTASHAKRELEILSATATDPDSRPIIEEFKDELIALCQKFGNSGQSGGSAPFTASALSQAVKKLCMLETIAPLTGEDDEWVDISDMNGGEEMYQNIRDSRVFKYGDGRATFIDAIVFDGDIGGRFTGNGGVIHNGNIINSSQHVKSFPFTPKTFYIDVIDHRWIDKEETMPDPKGDWWTHTVKDPEQLKEVWEYYQRPA